MTKIFCNPWILNIRAVFPGGTPNWVIVSKLIISVFLSLGNPTMDFEFKDSILVKDSSDQI